MADITALKTWSNTDKLFGVDLTNEFANVYTKHSSLTTAQTISGRKTFTGGVVVDEILSVAASGAGFVKLFDLRWDPASGTLADNDGMYVDWTADDDGTPTETIYARDGIDLTDVSDTTEDGVRYWSVMTAGSLARELNLSGAALYPQTNDGLALGTTTLGFSDLHLATGGVVNWANGEVTLTETDANTLTVAGATTFDMGAVATLDFDGAVAITGGNVGIGGTANDKFHVYGADGAVTGETWNGATQVAVENNGNLWVELMTPNTSYAVLAFSDSDASTRGAVIYDHGTALGWGADSLVFQTAGSQRVGIDSVGNLGFTIAPGAWLSTLDAIRLGGNSTLHALGATQASNYFVISQNAILATDGTYDYISTDEASRYYQQDGTHTFSVAASGTAGNDITWVNGLQVTTAANVVVNQAAIATTATDGFIYIPSCAGTPTGSPTAYTGRVAMVYDSTNNLLYCNDGGGWVAANNP